MSGIKTNRFINVINSKTLFIYFGMLCEINITLQEYMIPIYSSKPYKGHITKGVIATCRIVRVEHTPGVAGNAVPFVQQTCANTQKEETG